MNYTIENSGAHYERERERERERVKLALPNFSIFKTFIKLTLIAEDIKEKLITRQNLKSILNQNC